MKTRIVHGLYEAAAAGVAGTASTLVVDAAADLGLGLLVAALVGGGAAALEVVKEVAGDVRDHYRDRRVAKVNGRRL